MCRSGPNLPYFFWFWWPISMLSFILQIKKKESPHKTLILPPCVMCTWIALNIMDTYTVVVINILPSVCLKDSIWHMYIFIFSTWALVLRMNTTALAGNLGCTWKSESEVSEQTLGYLALWRVLPQVDPCVSLQTHRHGKYNPGYEWLEGLWWN